MSSTKLLAKKIRLESAKMILARGYGHLGSFSIVEVLAVLYDKYMKIDTSNPNCKDRDYLILSKGHCTISHYAALALKGFFPVEDLYTFNQNGAYLSTHPNRLKIPGIDSTSGSLGQGLSIAAGIAVGLKTQNKDNSVYCIIGDGECQEGQIWEAFYTASKRKLNNLIFFIDNNKKQCDGNTADVSCELDFEPIKNLFGFYFQRVDGHDVDAIDTAIQNAKKQDVCSVIVLDTVKGYGVPCFESIEHNHHVKINTEEIKEQLSKFIKDEEDTLC